MKSVMSARSSCRNTHRKVRLGSLLSYAFWLSQFGSWDFESTHRETEDFVGMW